MVLRLRPIRRVVIAATLVSAFYLITAYTNFPGLSYMRDLWIETAMTTGDHQWLANIFPQSVIEETMSDQVYEFDGIAGVEESSQAEFIPAFFRYGPFFGMSEQEIQQSAEAILEEQRIEEEQRRREEEEARIRAYWEEGDPLRQQEAAKNGVDQTGRKVLYNDIDQGVMISLVSTPMYTGRIVQVCDPSRVIIASTDNKGVQGKLICDYLSDYNAILGVNASGFADYNGNGMGGEIIGRTRSQGVDWGNQMYESITVGFTQDDKLIAGIIDNWDYYGLRDAIQFGPVLIKDGKILTEGTAGWGLQPRTIVAQRADGAVLFFVVDGRKPGYSIGATMGDCAEVLLEYDAVTAAACDGGSSSVLAYNGQIINDPSTPMTTGRYLPNAFLVLKR